MIRRSNFLIRLRSWEYWPFGIIQLPLFFYFAWLALRARSLTFFSASNPGILMGGMFGESKYEVLKKVPAQYIPKTILIQQPASGNNVIALLEKHHLPFPLIFKPDLGERGFMVKRINDINDVEQYLIGMKHDFLAQELVGLPLEFGVFYTRFPKEEKGKVTSVVLKEMLSVTGDGTSSLQDLILQQDRAKLQWKTLKKTYHARLKEIIPANKKVEIVSVGNHCLGTKFLDGSHLINDRLSATFDKISKYIGGFYFGRFDLRCATIEDLYSGNIKIMELNGCGAEPAHIYQPGYPLFRAIAVLLNHWRNIFEIARENVSNGAQYIPFKQAVMYYKRFKIANK